MSAANKRDGPRDSFISPRLLERFIRRFVPRGIRNFARSPRATVASLTQELAFWFGRTSECRVRPDWVVRCHPVSRHAFVAQSEDRDCRYELDGFIARCTPGMTLLDLGSHYGVFTLTALHYGGPDARVWAVDPSAAGERILKANLKLAGACDRVTFVRAAVGDRDGELAMLTTGAAGDNFMVAADHPRSDAVVVPQFALPTLAARIPSRVTHLKIDVEGFEWAILAGGSDYLREVRPLLFLELHGDFLRNRSRDPGELLRQLTALGYDRFEYRGRLASASEIAALPLARIVCLPAEPSESR